MVIIKSVAFNEEDPDQKKMLDHANKRTNFSAYIKRLIQRDLEGVFTEKSTANNADLMRALI